jgi:hypothetical protein
MESLNVRKILTLALIAMPYAVSAQERPAHVVAFNGFYLTVSMSTLDTVADFSTADTKAAQICETVGKEPELQSRDKVTPNRFMLHYVCI